MGTGGLNDMKFWDQSMYDGEEIMAESTETRKDWEVVQQDIGKSLTERLKVRNGWLYRTITSTGAVALVFVQGE